MKLNRIASFEVNHDNLKPGIYISRVDGDIITFDLRTRTPNAGEYMDNCTMHTFEHMFATYIRNSEISDHIIYFGPMGCQTGFYLLVRDVAPEDVLMVVKRVMILMIAHDEAVFGATSKECGNYRNLSLETAQTEAKRYLDVLESKEIIDFRYQK